MTAALANEKLFFQHVPSSEIPRLEFYVRLRDTGEHHVYLKALSCADFASVYEQELRAMHVLVYRMPPSLLNPNYWEPLTRDNENAVREKLDGIVTWQDGERTMIWRADSIGAGRWLRDGLDAPIELYHGYIFRTTGDGLLALMNAWTDARGRFEWMAFSSLPAGDAAKQVALHAHNDLTAFRLSMPEEKIAFASSDDFTVRTIFGSRPLARKAAAAAVRSFFINSSHTICAPVTDRVADQILRVCDGVGIVSHPERDFVNKHRALEATGHMGRTEWGVHLRPDHPPLIGNEKALIYYDHTSGIWAVAT